MPDRQITARDFAALCFRILGVVILLNGIAEWLFVFPSVAQGDWTLWGVAKLVGLLASLAFLGAIVLPLVFHAEKLVAWLFPETDKTVFISLTSRELLTCGLALIGAWFLAGSLPYLARLAGEIVWYSEGDRRAQLGPEFLRGIAFDALGSAFAAALGWVLFRNAARISAWWGATSRGGK